MGVESFSSLGRPLDRAYTSNRGIAAFSGMAFAAAIVIEVLRGRPILSALVFGLVAGVTVFLAWALTRELDPDHDVSAFLGAALALVAVWAAYPPGLLALFLTLLLLRVVSRSTGMASRPSDSAVIALLAAFLTWVGAWYMGVAAALAFLLDARLPPPHRPQAYVSVAMILVVASYLVTSAPGLGLAPGFGSGGAMWAAALIPVLGTLAMVPLIVASGDIRSFGDVGGERLEARRVRAAQILALVIGWGAVLTLGWAGLTAMLPLWAAIFGATSPKRISTSRGTSETTGASHVGLGGKSSTIAAARPA